MNMKRNMKNRIDPNQYQFRVKFDTKTFFSKLNILISTICTLNKCTNLPLSFKGIFRFKLLISL